VQVVAVPSEQRLSIEKTEIAGNGNGVNTIEKLYLQDYRHEERFVKVFGGFGDMM
jgi:hypothetical protein